MGKNVSIYIKDEILEHFEGEPNKSELINELLELHYSNDIKYIKMKFNYHSQELEALNKRLDKEEQRIEIKESLREKEEQKQKEKEERLNLIERFNSHFNGGEINDLEYWDAYNSKEHTFDLEKVKKILNNLKEPKNE